MRSRDWQRRMGRPWSLGVWGRAVLGLGLAGLFVSAQDHPQWRGATRDGRIEGLPARTQWPGHLRPEWAILVGKGHSSPLYVAGRVFLHTRRVEDEQVLAIESQSGKILWSDRYPAPYQVNPAAASHGKGPKSTPVFAQGRLYTLGITGILSCYDATKGTLLWRKRFEDRFPSSLPLYGVAASPLVDQGTLYLHVGGPKKGAFLALEAATGKEKWAWTGDGPAYASPILATFGGIAQLITQTEHLLIGLAPQTGELLWKLPFETDYAQNIVTPIVWRDLLLFSGLNKGVTAIRPHREGQVWVPEQVWHNREVSMYMSSPVLIGNHLWGHAHRNKGQFFCLDASTGRTLWVGDPRQGEHASIFQANGLLFTLNERGEMVVTRADPRQPQQLRQYRLGESAIWAHPVLFHDLVLFRDETHLRLFRLID
jgi:outer membrane protein assembly factor BamB